MERKQLYPLVNELRESKYKNVTLRWNQIYVDGNECSPEMCRSLLNRRSNSSESTIKSQLSSQPAKSTDANTNNSSQIIENCATEDPKKDQTPTLKRKDTDEIVNPTPPKTRASEKTQIIGSETNKNPASAKHPLKDVLRKRMQQPGTSKQSTNTQ